MSRITWLDWFLSQPSSRFFVRIDDDYLSNLYNYYGLKQTVNNFQSAYELLRKNYISSAHANTQLESDLYIIEQQTINLYGFLHARYLLTEEGMEKVYQKYQSDDYPHCPRILCKKKKCIPIGVSLELYENPVKIFCPNCRDVYNIKDSTFSKVDGAFFGNSWIPIFLKKYPDIISGTNNDLYIPRIFGFRICVENDEEKESSS